MRVRFATARRRYHALFPMIRTAPNLTVRVGHTPNRPTDRRTDFGTRPTTPETTRQFSREGASLSAAHPHHAVVTTHGNDRIDHAVFSDAVHEIRDQGCVVTDVGFQLSDCRQAVRDVAGRKRSGAAHKPRTGHARASAATFYRYAATGLD